jgi:hypothetical protein
MIRYVVMCDVPLPKLVRGGSEQIMFSVPSTLVFGGWKVRYLCPACAPLVDLVILHIV